MIETFLFDQISLVKFWKNRSCSISSNWFDEQQPIEIKIPTCEEQITKISLQMNEYEIEFQGNNNLRLQIVQAQFTNWKYKVKLSTEAANRGVL